jgi:hypothetical protein
MNDNENTFQTFIDTLASETGIDNDSATKVATWLKLEGVLDFPVLNETFEEGVR